MGGPNDDEIQEFLRAHGVTRCPPRVAATLGQTTAGWRRKMEVRAEQRGSKAQQRHQKLLAARGVSTNDGGI